jgi:hypothetical protein
MYSCAYLPVITFTINSSRYHTTAKPSYLQILSIQLQVRAPPVATQAPAATPAAADYRKH